MAERRAGGDRNRGVGKGHGMKLRSLALALLLAGGQPVMAATIEEALALYSDKNYAEANHWKSR